MKRALWPFALAGGGFVLGLVLVCIAPFAAVGLLALRTLPVRVAIGTVGAMWCADQVLGLAFRHYPPTVPSLVLGLAVALAALAGGACASKIRPLPAAFLIAFAVYELVQYAFALVFGGSDAFTPAIVLEVLEGNALGLVILWALRLIAQGAGVLERSEIPRLL